MEPTGTPMDPSGHDRVEELMAGYALRSLAGEDAAEADRLLSEHVPGCGRCRATLLAFSDTVADLALAADPMTPPETLLPRLHRELEPRALRPAAGRWVAMASGLAVVLIAGGLAVSQGLRAGDFEAQSDLFAGALAFSQRPGASTAPLVGAEDSNPAPVSELTAPDEGHFYLVGNDVPPPAEGLVYGIWLSDGVEAVFARTFLPGPGMTVVDVPFDRSRFDRVIVTLEVEGVVPAVPGEVLWEAPA